MPPLTVTIRGDGVTCACNDIGTMVMLVINSRFKSVFVFIFDSGLFYYLLFVFN